MTGHEQRGEFLAECFWPGVAMIDIEALDVRLRREAAASGGRDPVVFRGSHVVPGDEVVLCFFEGSSLEAVEAVAQRAGLPYDRIVESLRVGSPER